jgi:hypothetical protein
MLMLSDFPQSDLAVSKAESGSEICRAQGSVKLLLVLLNQA